MATWITIAPEDLADYQAAALVNAARTAALASGQADPFDQVMPDVVARIRAEIRGCKTNRVSLTPDSIPPDLKSTAILLVVEAMQARLPGVALDEGIKTLIADAKKYLVRIAKCEVPVGLPDDPELVEDIQAVQGTPMITARERNFTPMASDGI